MVRKLRMAQSNPPVPRIVMLNGLTALPAGQGVRGIFQVGGASKTVAPLARVAAATVFDHSDAHSGAVLGSDQLALFCASTVNTLSSGWAGSKVN